MRLLHAFGLSLVSSGAALSFTGICATADAQPSYRAVRDAEIAEFKAPGREGFDKVIVQLAPLTPVRGARKPAAAAAMAAPATPASAPPVEPADAPAAAAAPEAIRHDAPAEVEAAAQPSEPAAVAPQALERQALEHRVLEPRASEPYAFAPHAVAPNVESAPAPPLAEIVVERAPVTAPPEAAAPVEMSSESPPATESSPASESPPASEPPLPVTEALKDAVAPAPAPEGAQSATPAMTEAAPIVAQDAPPPASASAAEDDQDPGSWSWSLLTFIVALASLAGFAIARRHRARGVASALPTAPAAPARKNMRLSGIVASLREKLASTLLAMRARLRDRKGTAKHASAEPEPDWARIATSLRERAGSAAGAAAARESSDVVDAPAPKAETKRWEQDREDGVELLEPGSNSARALVMNARRKLQAVGER